MATNWPPSNSYPSWPPAELNIDRMEFSSIQSAIYELQSLGFTKANPTAQENNLYFKQVRCDHGDPCQGIMIVSPAGVRYPFAYCTGADHKAGMVLWVVGYNSLNQPVYDLGFGSGELIP